MTPQNCWHCCIGIPQAPTSLQNVMQSQVGGPLATLLDGPSVTALVEPVEVAVAVWPTVVMEAPTLTGALVLVMPVESIETAVDVPTIPVDVLPPKPPEPLPPTPNPPALGAPS